jgi:thiamine biosynthesis lipoprotein
VIRPGGVRLDSGGVAKGFFGDVLAGPLSWHDSFAVAAAGDIRFGGAAGIVRRIEVRSPFDERSVLHCFELARGAAATSGTTRRAWIDLRGRLAHHILDPATGRPAFTGVVQVTALAASGVEAEALAKAALLAGRDCAAEWLPHGGLVVYDDGGFDVIDPPEGEAST